MGEKDLCPICEFADKVRSLSIIGSRSGDKVRDLRDHEGKVIAKETTDQNNTIITERDNRLDIVVRPRTVGNHTTISTVRID